jgi:hypothetical protein
MNPPNNNKKPEHKPKNNRQQESFLVPELVEEPELKNCKFKAGEVANVQPVLKTITEYLGWKMSSKMANEVEGISVEPTEPRNPSSDASDIVKQKWSMNYKSYKDKMTMWTDQKGKVCHFLLNHCNEQVKTKVQNCSAYASFMQTNNITKLIKGSG